VKLPTSSEKHYRLRDDQVLFPALFKTCPLTLRTKTFLLCKDVRRYLGHLQSRKHRINYRKSSISPPAKQIGTERSQNSQKISSENSKLICRTSLI